MFNSTKLLAGPYEPPALRKGDRAFCLYLDCDVRVMGWSSGRISWPRARAIDRPRGGHNPLLITDVIVRAIRSDQRRDRAQLLGWWN
jgi:hypothetical protein